MSRMFGTVTKTVNPIVGCPFLCSYCWARRLSQTRLKHLYSDFTRPEFFPKRLKNLPKTGTIFVCDMGDMMSPAVPNEWIEKVFEAVASRDGGATYIFLTKNPARYHEFTHLYSENMVWGATVESDMDRFSCPYGEYDYRDISKAPYPSYRLSEMVRLPNYIRRFLSIEPILDFNTDKFASEILSIKPEVVFIGYDNYGHRLPEPTLIKTKSLVARLRSFGIEIRMKTLRPAWYELQPP